MVRSGGVKSVVQSAVPFMKVKSSMKPNMLLLAAQGVFPTLNVPGESLNVIPVTSSVSTTTPLTKSFKLLPERTTAMCLHQFSYISYGYRKTDLYSVINAPYQARKPNIAVPLPGVGLSTVIQNEILA